MNEIQLQNDCVSISWCHVTKIAIPPLALSHSKIHGGGGPECGQPYIHGNNCTQCHQTITAFCRGFFSQLVTSVWEYSFISRIISASRSPSSSFFSPGGFDVQLHVSAFSNLTSLSTYLWQNISVPSIHKYRAMSRDIHKGKKCFYCSEMCLFLNHPKYHLMQASFFFFFCDVYGIFFPSNWRLNKTFSIHIFSIHNFKVTGYSPAVTCGSSRNFFDLTITNLHASTFQH